MANTNVLFSKMTSAKFATITPVAGTFYWVTTTENETTKNDFYFGAEKLNNVDDITAAINALSADGGAIKALADAIGTVSNLETTTKTDLVSAINEIKGVVDEVPVYTLVKKATADSGYAASYNLMKDDEVVGDTINIPKDYLVKDATIETVTTADEPVEGYVVGDKYIDFVVNSVNGDGNESHLYLLISEFFNIYTSGNGIVVGADNSISVKISETTANGLSVDANGVALALATPNDEEGQGGTAGAMSAVDKTNLDSALQPEDIVTGETNGTVAVNGTDVKVKGLDSAAYAKTTDFDAAGAADDVLGTEDDTAEDVTVHGVKKAVEAVAANLVWNEVE